MAEETISLFIRAFTSMHALSEKDCIEVTMWLCSCFSFQMSDDDQNEIETDILEQNHENGVCELPLKANVEIDTSNTVHTEYDHGTNVLGQNGICKSPKTANVETFASNEVSNQFQTTLEQPDFPTPEIPRQLHSQSLEEKEEEEVMYKRSGVEEKILSKQASKSQKTSLDPNEFTKVESPQVAKSYFSLRSNLTTSTVVKNNLASSKVMQAGENSLSVDKTIRKSRYSAVPGYFRPVSSSTPKETGGLKSQKRLWNVYASQKKDLEKDNQQNSDQTIIHLSSGESHERIAIGTPTFSRRRTFIGKEQQVTRELNQESSSRLHTKSDAAEQRFEKPHSDISEESKDYANSSSVCCETTSKTSDSKCESETNRCSLENNVSTKCYSSSTSNEFNSVSICRECGERITPSNMEIHFNHMKPEFQRFHCDWCNKSFVWKETLIRHCIAEH